MKIRNLLAVVAMLSVFIIGIGTAHAVLGVNDDVPGQEIAFPVVCSIDGGLNTNWAIADKNDGPAIDPTLLDLDPKDAGTFEFGKPFVAQMEGIIYNVRSVPVHDWPQYWTAYDVEVWDCKGLVATLNANQKAELSVDLNEDGVVDHYAGYVVYKMIQSNAQVFPDNRFVGWGYLIDLNKGFASGFNLLSMEGGEVKLAEDGGFAPVTAFDFFPRYILMNDKPDTWNWWIFLAGRNEINCINAVFHRTLAGLMCNETEQCVSLDIEIPDELNIIDVADWLPGSLHAGYPKAGFATLAVQETGSQIFSPAIQINGTLSPTGYCGIAFPWYSMFGWSYERAEMSTSSLSWDVIHPMHRTYCSGGAVGAPYIDGPECTIEIVGIP